MIRLFYLLLRRSEGATSIEYALIAAFIFLAIITTVTKVGGTLSNTFNSVATNI